MNRLTLLVLVFLFAFTGYAVYLSRLAVDSSRRQRDELTELAAQLAKNDPGNSGLEAKNEDSFEILESRIEKLENMLDSLKVSKRKPRQNESASVSLPVQPPVVEDGIAPRSTRPDRYHVGRGETLWGISKKLYGNPWHWHELWKANEAKLPVYRRLPAGFVLVIPG